MYIYIHTHNEQDESPYANPASYKYIHKGNNATSSIHHNDIITTNLTIQRTMPIITIIIIITTIIK